MQMQTIQATIPNGHASVELRRSHVCLKLARSAHKRIEGLKGSEAMIQSMGQFALFIIHYQRRSRETLLGPASCCDPSLWWGRKRA